MEDSVSMLSYNPSINSVVTEIQYAKTNQQLKTLNFKMQEINENLKKENKKNNIDNNSDIIKKNNILNDKLINCLEESNLKSKTISDLEKRIILLENSTKNLLEATKGIKSDNERLREERNFYRNFYDSCNQ
jgi:hypothetical protein